MCIRDSTTQASSDPTARGGSGSGGGGGGAWHVRFHVIAEIKISDRLEFDGGSERLRDESQETLRAVAKVLRSRKDIPRLTIEGHTCSDGPEQWNMTLSRERADTVRNFLLDECGVSRECLLTTGHGPTKPCTDAYVNRHRNRRVEFLVL